MQFYSKWFKFYTRNCWLLNVIYCIDSITIIREKQLTKCSFQRTLNKWGSSYLLPSKIFLAISVAIGIRHSALQHIPYVRLCLFIDAWLLALTVFRYLRKPYIRSTAGQTRLTIIAIINIENILCKPHSSGING